MTLINLCLGVVAFGLMWPAIVFAICCAGMSRLSEPFPEREWYGRTLPPMPEQETRPLPVAAVPCLQEGWVRQVMAELDAQEARVTRETAQGMAEDLAALVAANARQLGTESSGKQNREG